MNWIAIPGYATQTIRPSSAWKETLRVQTHSRDRPADRARGRRRRGAGAGLVAPPACRPRFDLPAGFQPEGIAIGNAPYAYFGSRADGDIYRASLNTGRGEVISQGPGTPSLGLKLDGRGRLFVAGGSGGDARVVDARSGRVLKSYTAADRPVLHQRRRSLTGGSAWYTDSTNPTLFQVPLGRHGKLPSAARSRSR